MAGLAPGLTTIQETEQESRVTLRQNTEKRADKNKKWVFQGKVQGSIVFRQYYPEAAWLVFTDIIQEYL